MRLRGLHDLFGGWFLSAKIVNHLTLNPHVEVIQKLISVKIRSHRTNLDVDYSESRFGFTLE
jgi:hypothetical protein